MKNSSNQRPGAVLVGVKLPDVSDIEHESNLAELARLATTLGFEPVAHVTQRRDALSPAAVLGEGKLKELAELTGGVGPGEAGSAEAEEDGEGSLDSPDEQGNETSPGSERPTVVIVDHEITPSQAHHLEKITGARVLDRTGVIVEIFHRHAQSREARLQVEIARLSYVAPRLRESGNSERQAGRGAGESALELDRRKIRDRIAELRRELASIQREQGERRKSRSEKLRVALVGYTNAGKSSLMRALTGSEVLVADKLFATLDTTVRALQPETKPRILVSDTVGFIRKLPHDLVASFRSTLDDEAHEASLLLHVVDASDPTWDKQLEVTRAVLREIGADHVPHKLVFNKADRMDGVARAALQDKYAASALVVSARDPRDVAHLRQVISDFFEALMVDAELIIPYAHQSFLGQVYGRARVLGEAYDEAGTHLRVRALPATVAQLEHGLRELLASDAPESRAEAER